ncbi:hypothetical protein L1987_35566 [Smallanthus sonchifolius]|uniref:Uncharacterized protein n=1 Tax=Smallanthus sonchifolius TaxID=185202 RepID=A0ACB9HCF0_9ASTR|nr:hypothetical protein L1987_35566 [Smallanthus sonchifolius]
MVVDLGLSFGENGVALATATPGEAPAAGESSPLGAQPPQGIPSPDIRNSVQNQEQEQKKPMDATGTMPSEPLSIPICLMNTNMEIPVSPVRGQVIHEEILEPMSGFQSQQNIDNSPSSPMPIPNAWNVNQPGRLTFAEQIKANNESEDTRLEYFPPSVTPTGGKCVIISQEDLKFSAMTFSLHLYGYILGTSMDFRVVNDSLRRLWRSYDLEDIFWKSDYGLWGKDVADYKSTRRLKASSGIAVRTTGDGGMMGWDLFT